MIKRLYIYLLMLLALTACSDDFDPSYRGIDENGNIHINFAVSPLKTMTRAGDGLTSVIAYGFDNAGNLVATQTLSVIDNTALLGPEPGVSQYYFVANLPEYSVSTTAALEEKTTTALETDGLLAVSSKLYSLSELKDHTAESVELVHNAVKVTASKCGKDAENKDIYDPNLATYPFLVAGSATQSSVLAGGLSSSSNPKLGDAVAVTKDNLAEDNVTDEEKYIHSTKNESGEVYTIVKVSFPENSSNYYYYRLDFQNTVDGKINYFSPEPNHWYQFLIKSVKGIGYSTPADAAQHPTLPETLDYVIHDHAPVIYNMVSDGIRELGVSHQVLESESQSRHDKLYIKLYSPTQSEEDLIPTGPAAGKTLTETLEDYIRIDEVDQAWLQVKSIKKVTASDIVGSDGYDDNGSSAVGDKNNPGVVYEVEFDYIDKPGSYKTEIEVAWMGLTRKVPVTWDRSFDPSLLFSPDIEVEFFEGLHDQWETATSNAKYYNKEYFNDFIKVKSVGTSAADNNGVARDNGLHFPMPYGSTDTKWTYMYKVSINTSLGEGNFSVSSDNGVSGLEFSNTGTSGSWASSLTEGTGNVFYVRRASRKDDYNYETGTITITINGYPYPLQVFHTGFFHYEGKPTGGWTATDSKSNNYSISDKVTKEASDLLNKYAYYEVVSGGGTHWLDRNIGAQSAANYILGASGDLGQNTGKAGYYMLVGKYTNYNNTVQYVSPAILKEITPPGYTVPSVEQWDALRKSTAFHTELTGAYYTAYLQTDVIADKLTNEKKRVYFPKIQYYNNGIVGESRAGYYWTSTMASGLEKVEIGNWLKCLTIAGSATSYINGRVHGKDTPYYMSLRAVADGGSSAQNKKYTFWVKGATHLYLYTVVNGVRQPVTSWPGQAIGNAETMTATKEFNFTYVTKDQNPLYVIFNYVQSNGQIYTSSKNNYHDATNFDHTTISPKTAEGWLVYGADSSTEFNGSSAYAGCGVTVGTTLNNGMTTANTHWSCALPPTDDVITYYLSGTIFGSATDWNTTDTKMTQSGSNWVYTGTVKKGYFGIRKYIGENGSDGKSWIQKSGDKGTVVFNTPMKAIQKGTGTGTNWGELAAGTYTFTYNPSAMTLTVTNGSDPGPDPGIVKYRIYFPFYENEFMGFNLWNLDDGINMTDIYSKDNFDASEDQDVKTGTKFGRYGTYAYYEFTPKGTKFNSNGVLTSNFSLEVKKNASSYGKKFENGINSSDFEFINGVYCMKFQRPNNGDYSKSKGQPVIYRIYWYKDHRTAVKYNEGNGTSTYQFSNQGSETFNSATRYYIDVAVTDANTNCYMTVCKSDGSDEYQSLNSSGWANIKNNRTAVSGKSYDYTVQMY